MKEYASPSIRNVALVSHGGAGKTSLVEALLFSSGATTRLGRVEDGTTVSDFEEEEIRRRISLSTGVVIVEHDQHKINLLDTPGYTDFVGEVKSALRVADAALVLVDAVAGVEVGTELTWQYGDEMGLPRFVVINKMDRDNANFESALQAAQALSSVKLIPVQLPWGQGRDFKGVIDLLGQQAWPAQGKAAVEIPADIRDEAEAARVALIEAAAEGEDALLEKYLGGEELTADEVAHGFKRAVLQRAFVPVFACAATANVGVQLLLAAIVRNLPSPEEVEAATGRGRDGQPERLAASDSGPLSAYVWKTTADPFVGKLTYLRVVSGVLTSDSRVWNHRHASEERVGTLHVMRGKEQIAVKALHAGDVGTVAKLQATTTGDTLGDRAHPIQLDPPTYPAAFYAVAVTPKSQADSAKMGPTLTRLVEEDPTLSWHNDPTTHQTILKGMGDQHIDVAVRRAESKFQVGLHVEVPRVPYREAITRTAESHYRHKKQTGGAGQFGEVYMRVEPLADQDFEFVSEVVGGAISSSFLGPIEKGVRSVIEQGVVAGYPVVNVLVAVTDGKMHEVDSKPIAFEIAGREAFKLGVHSAGPVIQEPIYEVRIVVPDAAMGDVMGDLNARRGRVHGMETERGKGIVTAHVPLAELQRYSTDLRSLTGGRGVFTMEFLHYEVVPAHIAQGIIAQRHKERGGAPAEE